MNIKDKAREFAIKAHMGQVRKSEPDKPLIIHPISVAMILEEYGYDESVIAAGYLHDVVEDTKYTIEDIKKEFGEDIANLVMDASEPDKSLSWEERKSNAIERVKKLPLRNKLVICADKINNIEDIMLIFQKKGKKDFSSFNRGYTQQKWFYNNIYNSLIYKQDENLPMFIRLKNDIDIVFNKEDDSNLSKEIIKIDAQRLELQRLKKLCKLSEPFMIEFKINKKNIINNSKIFLDKSILTRTKCNNIHELSIIISSQIMVELRNKYINCFKEKYNIE